MLLSCNRPAKETSTTAAEPPADGEMDSTSLPIKEPARPLYTELDASKAKAPARFAVKAPKGAPNVIVDGLLHLGNLSAALSNKFESEWVNNLPIEKRIEEKQVDPSMLFDTRVCMSCNSNFAQFLLGCVILPAGR